MMTNQELKEIKRTTAQIIISARKMLGLTQNDIADNLKIAQSTISRIEAKKLIPSMFLWMEISELLDIPYDSIPMGYLDKEIDAEIATGRNENGFLIPLKYSTNKCIKVRKLLPLVQFICDKWGKEKFEALVGKLRVNKNFFINLDNQLNVAFMHDFLELVEEEISLNDENIAEIANYLSCMKSHGRLARSYQNSHEHITLLKKYIKNSAKYQAIFNYKIESSSTNSLTVTIKKNPQIQTTHKTLKFFEIMQENSFKKVHLIKKTEHSSQIEVVKKYSLLNKNEYTQFEITVH